MTRYVYYACENIYGGLHGMNTYGVVEAGSEDEIALIARTAAYEVIESYGCIAEALEEDVDEEITPDMDDFEINELRSAIYGEDIDYTWRKIDESKAGKYTTRQLDGMCYNMGYDEFVKTFC